MLKSIHRVTVAFAFLCTIFAGEARSGCDAEPFVRNAGSAIMSAARTKSPAAFSGVASRYADMRAISLFALGAYRGKLPKAQEGEFVALTGKYVGRVMAKHSRKFNANGLTITNCSGAGKHMTVAVRLSAGQKVVFRLQKSRGGYRVQDLNVSSVWLAQQLRATFAGVIRREGDIAGLIRYLRG